MNKIQLIDLVAYPQKDRDEEATTKIDLAAKCVDALHGEAPWIPAVHGEERWHGGQQ